MTPSNTVKLLAAATTALGMLAPAHALVLGPGAGGAFPDGVAAPLTNINLATAGLFQSTISVASPGQISSFNSVTLRGLTHTWTGDLLITLSHNGTTVDLIDRLGAINSTSSVGAAGDLLGGDYTFMVGGAALPTASNIAPGTYATETNPAGGMSAANGALSDFNGMDLLGDWTLTVRDLVYRDLGSMTSWSFDVTVTPANPVPEPAGTGLLALAALGLALRARRT